MLNLDYGYSYEVLASELEVELEVELFIAGTSEYVLLTEKDLRDLLSAIESEKT